MSENAKDFVYLISAVLFILGLKGLTHPRTAVRGNFLGALGMLTAVIATLVSEGTLDWTLVAISLAIGAAIGAVFALKIAMTAMPQLVALFNGFGGAASVLVAGAFLITSPADGLEVLAATAASGLIGAVTFSGSLVAFAKLQELDFIDNIRIPAQQILNAVLVLLCFGFAIYFATSTGGVLVYWLIVVFALALGISSVISIGGADMPVVIALLNSYSGLAAAATGFVLSNNVLIISGSLVGASGLILTRVMCKAMNRSLANVLFGSMGGGGASAENADEVYATVKSTSAEEVAMLMDVSNRVVIVPGYGMAVAQAQHAVSDLTKALQSRQVKVEFGIHPVAGRMPGHMNVLLAEADVPYDLLMEMDEINPTLDQADVVVVLGANDVVNPVARTDPGSPIAGMPILDVDKAKTVIVVKRSLSAGFAGIPNPLFAADNSLMLFGDGRKAVVEITNALQEA